LHENYEETPSGTKLHISGTTELKGPQRMLAKPVLGQVKKQLVQELRQLLHSIKSTSFGSFVLPKGIDKTTR